MSLCILTNTSALFPPSSASCGRLIRFMALNSNENSLAMPAEADFSFAYNELEREFTAILVLASPAEILPGAESAQRAAQCHGGTAKISVLDTRQIGPGLGILAQLAARKAAAGVQMPEVEEYVRAASPYLFTLIYSENIGTQAGKKENKSEQTNEQTAAMPVYSLEDGMFTPYKKVRTPRHLLENLQEFLEEFERPQNLVYFHGKNANLHTRLLRDVAVDLFPGIPFNEVELNPALSALFGDRTVGLTVLELPEGNGKSS